jgi:hypothetical protein
MDHQILSSGTKLGLISYTALSSLVLSKGLSPPLTVRDYLHRKKLTRQAERRPDLNPGVLQSVFTDRNPRMWGNHVSMQRRSCT